MHAAYALFGDRLCGQQAFAIPCRSAGMEKRGRRLLERWQGIPAEPAHDRELVDAWAAEQGISDW